MAHDTFGPQAASKWTGAECGSALLLRGTLMGENNVNPRKAPVKQRRPEHLRSLPYHIATESIRDSWRLP